MEGQAFVKVGGVLSVNVEGLYEGYDLACDRVHGKKGRHVGHDVDCADSQSHSAALSAMHLHGVDNNVDRQWRSCRGMVCCRPDFASAQDTQYRQATVPLNTDLMLLGD